MDHLDTAATSGDVMDDEDDAITLKLSALAARYSSTKSRRSILQPSNIPEFTADANNSTTANNNKTNNHHYTYDSLFSEFARVVCEARCIPRKELWEAWAMAITVHACFFTNTIPRQQPQPQPQQPQPQPPYIRRFVDLASGHGLLSWALLVLANYHDDDPHSKRTNTNQNTSTQNRLSAICIDERMPQSADILQIAFLKHFHLLEDSCCWDYIQARLECMEPDAGTLIVGVHCCAKLSDRIIDLTIQGNCPLALVPCCHALKCLTSTQRQEYEESRKRMNKKQKTKNDSLSSSSSQPPRQHSVAATNLTDFIDAHRIQRLRQAGFHVVEYTIPSVFTPKNRIILAMPSASKSTTPTTLSAVHNDKSTWQMEYNTVCIPVADTPEARTKVRSIAGREAARQRQQHSFILPLSWKVRQASSKNSTDSTAFHNVESVPIVIVQQLETQVIQPLMTRRATDEEDNGGGSDKHQSPRGTQKAGPSSTPTIHPIHAQPKFIPKYSHFVQNWQVRYSMQDWTQREAARFHLEMCERIPRVLNAAAAANGDSCGSIASALQLPVYIQPLPKKLRHMAELEYKKN